MPHAAFVLPQKFGIDVPYEKVQIFQAAVEAHVKDRPREWLGFLGFRGKCVQPIHGAFLVFIGECLMTLCNIVSLVIHSICHFGGFGIYSVYRCCTAP